MNSELIVEFAQATQYVCLCTALSAMFVLVVIFLPINKIIGKTLVLVLLLYTLIINLEQTNKFSRDFDIRLNEWSPITANIICSYLFSVFVVILIISVFRKL
jgi:hypothetical protein